MHFAHQGDVMASDALLLLVGVPENYRLGGTAFQRLHRAHPRVEVRIVHDPSAFAQQIPQEIGRAHV